MPPHLRIAVHLAAWCQLRRGEIRGLRRQDIDPVAGTLSVCVTKTTAMSGRTVVKEPKTRAGRRTIAIPPHVLNLLTDHLALYVPDSPEACIVDASNRQLSLAWHKSRATLGRPELRFHDLRHSGLTWSAATGASVAELMRRAGHASQSAALRYQHATDDRDRVLADALGKLADLANKESCRLLSAVFDPASGWPRNVRSDVWSTFGTESLRRPQRRRLRTRTDGISSPS
jgi:integrase